MEDQIKIVVSFERDMVERAAAENHAINVSILPACAALMLRERKRITISTQAPEPTPDEVTAYIRRFTDEPHRTDLFVDYVVNGVGVVQVIERIADLRGVQPYDVAQGMCVGVPLSDTDFYDYLTRAQAAGVTHVDPRALIVSSVPLDMGEGDEG